MEFDAPENPGDVDRNIILVTGGAGAYGNLGNAAYLAGILTVQSQIGRQTNNSTMEGSVQLAPVE